MNVETIIRRLNNRIEGFEATLEKFQEKLKEDPVHALSWGLDAYKAAPALRIHKEVLLALSNEEKPADVNKVTAYLTRQVLQKSKYPPQSTSPTSNLIDQYELAALSELVECLTDLTED